MQTYVIVAKKVTGVFYYLDFNYALTQVAILAHTISDNDLTTKHSVCV